MRRIRPSGFTMIELMIVVAIIGILAAIALPRFADMMEKSREGATKGNLRSLKSAGSIYYAEAEGIWPQTINSSSTYRFSLYIDTIPVVRVTGKFDLNHMTTVPTGRVVALGPAGTAPNSQSSGWMYDSTLGRFFINSTLMDSKRVPYSFYGFE